MGESMSKSPVGAANALVIVESPTKAKTIRKYLGDGYTVEASMGHVRDLPSSASEMPEAMRGHSWSRLAVDVENGFQPVYVVPSDKKKIVSTLKKALKGKDVLYLATDEDREGEAIGWHLVQLLKPKVPVHRLVFHEITEEAIQKAINNPRELDENVVRAQEARRVLDRLVGYEISPLLWKKVAPGLSAGRVQSVAVRLLVMRERERQRFVTSTWWDLRATFGASQRNFSGQLISVDGTSIATGRSFDETTGKLKPGSNVRLLGETDAQALEKRLKGEPFSVSDLEQKVQKRRPYPPFTTSTLQQEANRKHGYAATRTMQIAQRLYENGHITYMRTDSVNLSNEAVTAVRSMVKVRYGDEFVAPKPRTFSTKAKGAQEAHEAIRPAGTTMSTARELGLSGDELKLYDLIWKRTVSTQMADAQISMTTAKITTKDPQSGQLLTFRASGRQVIFPGFFRAYVEGSDDPDALLEDRDQPLPTMTVGQKVDCEALDAVGHETRPPARYSVATLIKVLETEGIGRPSTYASIIDTIQRRGYVREDRKQLIPTFTAIAVTQLLEETLGKVIDVEFTASMEAWLDEIAVGKDAQEYLGSFYHGELQACIELGKDINPRSVCTLSYDKIDPYRIRVGKFGPFIEYDVDGEEKARIITLPDDTAPADVSLEFIELLKVQAKKADAPLGLHPDTQQNVYVRKGRFGPYVQLGEQVEGEDKPRRASLLPGMTLDDVDLDMALQLLKLPRKLGVHPEDGEDILANIGRYGPYVQHKRTYASVKAPESVLEVELTRALELIAEKATQSKKPEALRDLGKHPEDGEPIAVMDGRYGPYVKHKRTNATLPDGITIESVTLEQAIELITERAKKGKGKRRSTTGRRTTKR
jgi:DNA topoisomerase-1